MVNGSSVKMRLGSVSQSLEGKEAGTWLVGPTQLECLQPIVSYMSFVGLDGTLFLTHGLFSKRGL